ncbi:Protein of unknown function [Klenkia soli]|uniref:DUF1232 domain-containing protein n=1 Tax=Klenkia soli TaxID=1052260 RepID=A0A1H0NCE1_9ACTN|nr:DUF1232 domain-containing protein [Klenkia soli]SDO90382.1 Protein of unknown function [Klenkia soli]
MAWWQLLLGVLAGSVLLYVVLLALLWGYARLHPDTVSAREALRLLPDVVRFIKRLAGDGSLPRGVRVRLGLLLVYLASPVDLVPDVVPVIGYADDAVVVALVLRSVVRAAGPEALDRHWPGSTTGLQLVRRLAGISASGPA